MTKRTKTAEVTEAEVTAPALAQPTVTATAVAVAVTAETLTSEEDALIRSMKTKSEQMRYLASKGWKNGPIAKYLTTVYGKTVIYQHVRNVLKQPLKKETQTTPVS